MKRALLVIVVAAIVSAAVTLMALRPDPTVGGGTQLVPNSEVRYLNMHRGTVEDPDGLEDIAMRCDSHGHRIYANTRQFVVVDDPTCPVVPERAP